jgi:hypothetical protein
MLIGAYSNQKKPKKNLLCAMDGNLQKRQRLYVQIGNRAAIFLQNAE